MAWFDVYPMPGKGSGYVLDIQADLLSHLATRVVIPLLPEHIVPPPISHLNPIFEINGQRHVLVTQALASIPARELKKTITSLKDHHDKVSRALDLLLIGF